MTPRTSLPVAAALAALSLAACTDGEDADEAVEPATSTVTLPATTTTATVTAAPETETATVTAGPETVTRTTTAAPETRTVTVTAPAETVTVGPPEPEAAMSGDGTYEVGVDVQPGTYVSAGPQEICYWARLSGSDGFDSIIDNNLGSGQAIVTIREGDAFFETNGCNPWKQR